MSALLEDLSDLEHVQWAVWAQDVMTKPKLEGLCCTGYDDLPDSCREPFLGWAQKVVDIFQKHGQMFENEARVMNTIARLEFQQWKGWMLYASQNLTDDNISRWTRQIETDYADLSEEEKDKDREYARLILDALN
jgi:hypothetical protein